MRTFTLHFILALALVYTYFNVWEDTLFTYTAVSTVLVFSLLFFLLWLSTYFYQRSYFRKLPKFFSLLFFFLKEMLVANLKIAYEIITPRYHMQPTVLALPLDAKTDLEITLLANMISLTPGTLSIDVSPDRKHLYVHALYLKGRSMEELKQHIKHGFERRILELTS